MRPRPLQQSNNSPTQYINNMMNVNMDMRNNEDMYCTYDNYSLIPTNHNFDNWQSEKRRGNTTKDHVDFDQEY